MLSECPVPERRIFSGILGENRQQRMRHQLLSFGIVSSATVVNLPHSGSNHELATINPLQRVSLCTRSTPFSERETGFFFRTWLSAAGAFFRGFGSFPLSLLCSFRTCGVRSPEDHPYTNQTVTEKGRQAFLLGIGRAIYLSKSGPRKGGFSGGAK